MEVFIKKYQNLFQIGQVAVICGVTRKMILNHEALGLITPHTVDAASGYRYYDIYTVSTIQTILDLRQCGMSLADIGKYLRGDLSAENRIAFLERQRQCIDYMISEMKCRIVPAGSFEIEQIAVPESCCLCTEYIATDMDEAVFAYITAYEECVQRQIPFACYTYHFCEFPMDILSDAFFQTANFTMRICIAVDREKAPADAVIYPACKALSLMFRGAYENSFVADVLGSL